VESVTKKAVETYLSEFKSLQTQPSAGSASNIDYLAVEGDTGQTNDKDECRSARTTDTPIIQVEKSSSSCIIGAQPDDAEEDIGSDNEGGSGSQGQLEVPVEASHLTPVVMEQVGETTYVLSQYTQ